MKSIENFTVLNTWALLKQKAIMMFKSFNGLAPVYLRELFSERHTDYDLRDSFRKLNLPNPRTD